MRPFHVAVVVLSTAAVGSTGTALLQTSAASAPPENLAFEAPVGEAQPTTVPNTGPTTEPTTEPTRAPARTELEIAIDAAVDEAFIASDPASFTPTPVPTVAPTTPARAASTAKPAATLAPSRPAPPAPSGAFSWSTSFDGQGAADFGSVGKSGIAAALGRSVRYAVGMEDVGMRTVGGSSCLSFRYVPASNGSRRIEFPMPVGPADDLWLSYDLWLDEGWEPVRGGKLPGLAGGTSASGGNGGDGVVGFSARLMWGSDNALSVYAYYPDRPGTYGEWIGLGGGSTMSTGRWITITQHLWMNSAPDVADGGVQMFVNGAKLLDRGNMRWRATMGLNIDTLYFSTFYGGNDPSWAPVGTNSACIDNVRVSTSPLN